MSRRREPDREKLPPPQPVQAELAQSKAFDDRWDSGPPALDFAMGPEGKANANHKCGDRTPANDTDW